MIRRTLEARFLNEVANHPDVREGLGGAGPLDLTAIVSDPSNVALETEHGGWVLVRHEPGVYELHTLFLKEGRGLAHFTAGSEGLAYMFAATDAREIVTRVPDFNCAAKMSSRAFHFRERFRRENAWTDARGETCGISYRVLDIDTWCAHSAPALRAGEWFHEKIEAAKVAFSSSLPDHPEDKAHDRAAGAAVLMIKAGNLGKGVWFYNRWARLAGYAPITVLSQTPAIIDVGVGVIVEVREGGMEVIKCP